jgi:caa(3)-type oxidase subunit IV
MSENQTADIQKEVKAYITIFVTLIVLTLLTVGLSQLTGSVHARVTIAVTLALVQAFFSVGYLMHLNAEKQWVYGVLLLTVVFFGALIVLPILTSADSTHVSHVP